MTPPFWARSPPTGLDTSRRPPVSSPQRRHVHDSIRPSRLTAALGLRIQNTRSRKKERQRTLFAKGTQITRLVHMIPSVLSAHPKKGIFVFPESSLVGGNREVVCCELCAILVFLHDDNDDDAGMTLRQSQLRLARPINRGGGGNAKQAP